MNNLMGHCAFVNPWYKADAQENQDTSESSGSEINEEKGLDLESNILGLSKARIDGLVVVSSLLYHVNS